MDGYRLVGKYCKTTLFHVCYELLVTMLCPGKNQCVTQVQGVNIGSSADLFKVCISNTLHNLSRMLIRSYCYYWNFDVK